jgi:hypothetical protein
MALGFLRSLRRRRDDDVVPDMNGSMDGSLGGSLEGDSTGFASLKQFEKMHRLDPNLPLDELEEVDIALDTANVEKGAEIEQILAEDNSPYPEVRLRSLVAVSLALEGDMRANLRPRPRCELRSETSTSICL